MMNTALENLLSLLEDSSAEAVKMTDPALDQAADATEATELITERGTLLNRLSEVLAGSAQPSYLDWNRLVIIHRLGTQIEANLSVTRNNLLTELADIVRGRALLDCMSGVIEEHQTHHQISV